MDVKLVEIKDSKGNFLRHDINFKDGKLETVTGAEEIKNRIICNKSVYKGESYTDPNFGVDYFNNVFGRDVTDITVIDELKYATLVTRGVISIKSYDLTRAEGSRTAREIAEIKTTEGDITITTPINT